MESLEYQQWKAFGDRTKAVKAELSEIMMEYTGLVNNEDKRVWGKLVDTMSTFKEFRMLMEATMFEQVKWPNNKESNKIWPFIFFG